MAADWADMQEAQRRHQAMLRQQEMSQKNPLSEKGSEQPLGRGMHLSQSSRP